MDKAITTALLIVISMIMALMLFNVAYPAVIQGGEAIASMTNQADERMRSQVEVIHATGELDSNGVWQDTNSNGQFEAFIWVKNVGDSRIIAYESSDVFFGPEGNFTRIPHQSQAGGSFPYWTGQVENDAEWTPTSTLQIAIHYGSALVSGRYFVKVVIPSGVSADYFLGM